MSNRDHDRAHRTDASPVSARGRGAGPARRTRAPALLALGAAAWVILAGCGPVKLVANPNIPTPLVVKMPIAVALFVPKEFAEYVHSEERLSKDWRIDVGRAQTEGITRLLNAIFERVVPVESLAAAGALGSDIRAILEPSIEEYAFVTPRDAGSPFYAVSIKYRVNVYLPDGRLADSWGFTGYGTSPAQGLYSSPPLAAATALAMRDAGAKLAVEFREQAFVRGLLPDAPTADSSPSEPAAQAPSPAAPGTSELVPSDAPAVSPAAPESAAPVPVTPIPVPSQEPPSEPLSLPQETPAGEQQPEPPPQPQAFSGPPMTR